MPTIQTTGLKKSRYKYTTEPLDTGVYLIRNKINKKVYVGSAGTSIKERWKTHITALRNRISYFPEQAGKRTKFVIEESSLPFMYYVSHIRGLQSGGGQGALPGIVEVHLGPILIEDLDVHGFAGSNMYLIALQPSEELTLAREIRDKVGVSYCTVPSAITMLADQLDKSEKECIQLRERLNAKEHQLEQESRSIT